MDSEIESKLELGDPLTPQEVSSLTIKELEESLGYNFTLTEAEKAAVLEAALQRADLDLAGSQG